MKEEKPQNIYYFIKNSVEHLFKYKCYIVFNTWKPQWNSAEFVSYELSQLYTLKLLKFVNLSPENVTR